MKRQSFPFKLDFLTRCVTAIATQGAIYERVHKTSRHDLERTWATLSEVLDTVVGLLRGRAYVHSSEDLTTANVLVPIIVYLANNDGKFKDDRDIRRFLYWMYQAMLWARYSSRPDQMLDRDITHVLTAPDPVKALLDDIIDARGRLDLRPADLERPDARSPAFRIMHLVAKAQGAVDWFTGVPLAGNSSISNGDKYYIFPHNVLWASGTFTSDNHMHVKMVNEIENRVFLEKWTASVQAPSEVLPKVLERNPEALAQQFVPSDPELWKVENAEKCLALRREMIANGINSYLASLIDEKIPTRVFPQIAKLPEPAATQARDAVEKLTIEEVDIGLFKLGRLFEGTLKEFVKAAEASGAYPVKPVNYDKLAYMIDWAKAQGIIHDPTALHVLRQTRNDRAHEQSPSLEERHVLLSSAGWIAGMYLDYILFFVEQQKLLVAA